MAAKNAVRFENVDVVFGQKSTEAVSLLIQGEGRDSILDRTGCLVAVHDASLFVNEGEILVLMGLSGSGKSSLLRCVNGLNQVTRGSMLVNDGSREVDVATCDPETLRRLRRNRISMVFQQFALMPWMLMFVMASFAAGLQLYWVTNNILTILQQKWLYSRHPALKNAPAMVSASPAPPPPSPPPPAQPKAKSRRGR